MELDKGINDLFGLQKIINENPAKSILVLDSGNKIVFANEIFINNSGYSLKEIRGRSPISIGIGHNSPEEFLELFDTVGKGKTFLGRFRNLKKNGEEYDTETTVIPIYDNLNHISYYIAMSSFVSKTQKQSIDLKWLDWVSN